jgi:glycosyltransferase involved in cell wall biosynthesis
MKQPLLSICIPTHNRAKFLSIGLKRITEQLKDKKFKEQVEIIISDNNSTDNTMTTVYEYSKQYNFIRYFKNDKNIGINKNILKASKYAQGKYLWLLSDDDFILPEALKLIIRDIKKYKPIIIANNFITYNKKQDKKNYRYLTPLKTREDIFFENNIMFFEYLSTESFFTIRSFYCASLSFYICDNSWFKRQIKELDKYYPAYELSMYPQEWIYWWQFPEHKILINATPTLNITEGNNSWADNFYQANIIVKKYHNPIMKYILKKYSKKMNLKLKIKFLISPLFTQAALVMGKLLFLQNFN